MMKKLKLWLVTAGDFLFSVILTYLANSKGDELDKFFGPDAVMRDSGGFDHRFGSGTFLILVTFAAGIVAAVLVWRLGKEEKIKKIINIMIVVINTCFWTWLYIEDYYFYYMPDLPECFMPWP